MRRFIAVIAIASTLTLTACSLPAGIDGNLVNNWSDIPVPQGSLPILGDCYETNSADMIENSPIDCTTEHAIDVAYVGTFTGANAARTTPPPGDSDALKATYASCIAPTNTFLGGEWHTGVVQMTIAVPDDSAWQGGARWYRCDVTMLDSPDGNAISYSQSLKGALAAPGAVVAKCVTWDDHTKYVNNMKAAPCTKAYNGEYVGYFTGPNTAWPASQTQRDNIGRDGCENLVGKYLGFASWDSDTNPDVGVVSDNFDENRWNLGDRTIRCFAAADTKDHKFTASVKGIRSRTPKG